MSIGEETGPCDFYDTGELRGQIWLAGNPAHFAAPGPLWNDSDLVVDFRRQLVTDDPLQMVVVSPPNHGTLLAQRDGSFSYFPNIGYEGPDGFTYVATDGWLFSDPATVAFDVGQSGEFLANVRPDVV